MDERTHARYMSDIAYFLSKMEAEPNSGYFIPIALAYNKLEKYDETITMCKSAVERFPSNCAAKTLLAEAYIYKGDFDQARELLFDVTAEDDHNYKALKLLGVICKEREESAEALKYLTGAYIRAPEDADIRKMIEELGGTLNPSEIYDEREKKQKQNVAESEDDEELRTYMDIDQKIRSAEIIMAELVSDTSITSGAAYEDDDFESDDPNDFMPTISTVEYEDEEEDEEIVPDDVVSLENDTADNNVTTQSAEENDNDNLDISSESGADDLTAALSGGSEENDEEADDLTAVLSESSDDDIDDLTAALSGGSEENDEEADDLMAALSESSDDDIDNLTAALSGGTEENEEETDDLTAALSEGSDDDIDGLTAALSGGTEESEEEADDLTAALSGDSEESNEGAADNADISDNREAEDLTAVSSEETSDDVADDLTASLSGDIDESGEDEAGIGDIAADMAGNSEISDDIAEDAAGEAGIGTDENDIQVSDTGETDLKGDEENVNTVPKTLEDMTYEDMIGDDIFTASDDGDDKEYAAPQIDLGESAPFTQDNIMEEILDTAGMTAEDMTAQDETVSLKDKRIMKLENMLEKINKEKE